MAHENKFNPEIFIKNMRRACAEMGLNLQGRPGLKEHVRVAIKNAAAVTFSPSSGRFDLESFG